MNKVIIKFLLAVSLLAIVMVVFVGCGDNKVEGGSTVNKATNSQNKEKILTAIVTEEEFQPTVRANGTLVPHRHAVIKALVGGQITSMPVDIGTKVKKGQLLFEVRKVNYELDLEQAEANLERAKVAVADREREKNRIENLYKEGSATEQMRDQIKASYEEALAALKQAQAIRDRAAQMLADSTLTAPYQGVITARYFQEGEYVNTGDAVVELMDLSILNAEIEVPEPYIGKIKQGEIAIVSILTNIPPVEGKVIAINPKVNVVNRTFLVKVEILNENGNLHAGMFCTTELLLPKEKGIPSVPAETIIHDEGRSYVWLIKNGKAHYQEVKEGDKVNGKVVILSGLEPGQKIVTSGFGILSEGTEVN